MLSELIKELQEQLDAHGDHKVVQRSDEYGFESFTFFDFVIHEGENCLLVE